MKTRVLAAIPLVLCLLGAALIQSWFLVAFLVFISLMCQYEIIKAFNASSIRVYKALSFCFALIISILFIFGNIFSYRSVFSLLNLLIIFTIFIWLTFITTIFSQKHDITLGVNTIFTFIYPQLFLTLLYLIFINLISEKAKFLSKEYWYTFIIVLWIFLPANITDTFAYLVGRAFGKKKLAPAISPKKTVGGAVGGMIGGIICGVALGIVSFYLLNTTHIITSSIIIGAIIGVLAQFGDLSASLIKRKLDVKDYGKLIPGHGGVLDRVDSIIFCVPLIYICITFNIL